MTQSRYEELCQALEKARDRFAAYRSECTFVASTLARGLVESAAWPPKLVAVEPPGGGDPARPEDALVLVDDGFWALGLRLVLEVPKGKDSILVDVKFKKLPSRYIITLFGTEDFEIPEPTPEALAPIYEAILSAVRRHYDFGLPLFLENGGRGLKLKISPARLAEIARGHG